MSDSDIVSDFLVESGENLDRLDRELVELEKNPQDREALAGIFRTIHTIKGTCGFLAFSKLEKVAHAGENLLALLRDGKLDLDPEITTALLRTVDAIRQMLEAIQETGQDGSEDYPELLGTLKRLQGLPEAGASISSAKKAKSSAPAPSLAQTPEPLVQSEVAGLSVPVAPGSSTQSAASNGAAVARNGTGPAETIRVGVNLLDNLMTLVGELVLARNQLVQFAHVHEDTVLQGVSQRMDLIATELQEQVMKTRMQPIGNIWNQFPRTVRDVAVSCGKEVRIEMEGRETELDKTIIEAIKDPLTHLVRNSVDHGIELPEARVAAGKDRAGLLRLRAFHEGGQVNIEIGDDGGGLDAERIRRKAVERGLVTAEQASRMPERDAFNMIFLPGFSTAAKVTNVSGRGVGMDVVKTNVEKIGGTVDVRSETGRGTTVRIRIPLTLAIVPALMVSCGGERFAIPHASLVELVSVEGGEKNKKIETVHGAPVYRLRGLLLPLVYLREQLQLPVVEGIEEEPDTPVNIVVLQAGTRQFGLIVEEVNDMQEIVVKPLHKKLKGLPVFAGASIMGDGMIALILDVMGLAQHSGVISEASEKVLSERTDESAAVGEKSGEKRTFLVFEGPDNARMALPIETLDRLEELPASLLEHSGEQWMAQYRGRILPLIDLGYALEERRRRRRHPKPSEEDGLLQVLVCHSEGQTMGFVVERILDIVEDAAEVQFPASRPGVMCSAVINGRVTELIDIAAIVRSAGVPVAG